MRSGRRLRTMWFGITGSMWRRWWRLTFEQATAAANAVVVTYEAAPINVSTKFSED